MKPHLFAATALSVLGLAGVAAAAETVEIKNAVARVVVIAEPRSDTVYDIHPGTAALPAFTISHGLDGRLIIDGHVAGHFVQTCSRRGSAHAVFAVTRPPADLTVSLGDRRDVRLAEAPLIVVHTPLQVKVRSDGAVFGAVAYAQSLDLGSAGCGDWFVGNMTGALEVGSAGSGDIHAGSAGSLRANLAGSGDVTVNRVSSVSVDLAGSGDVRVLHADGPVHAAIAGSGDLEVLDGHTPRLSAEIAGSGDVRFEGEADTVDAKIMGSGDVRVGRVKGEVRKAVMGSGSVEVGR
jgi:hypothetical protein